MKDPDAIIVSAATANYNGWSQRTGALRFLDGILQEEWSINTKECFKREWRNVPSETTKND